jgi:hypothetical protein
VPNSVQCFISNCIIGLQLVVDRLASPLQYAAFFTEMKARRAKTAELELANVFRLILSKPVRITESVPSHLCASPPSMILVNKSTS